MTPSEPTAVTELRRSHLIAVIRAATAAAARDSALAVVEGGIPLIEVTFTVPDAAKVMSELSKRSGFILGAGTVLTRVQARAAIDAGARFIVAPNLSADVAEVARESGVMYVPGAYTATEILNAVDAGAHVVKVYPVGVAGGPAYIQVLRDPLPSVPFLAAGGTNMENTLPFLRAGCVGVGLGAALADPALAAAGNFGEITRRARAFAALVSGATAPA